MSGIKRVALAGASGNLGPAILTQLLKANFTVTVLTRQDSKSTFPSESNLTVVPVDYASVSSLTSALKGHDAVVSTLTTQAISVQNHLIDAAIAAGVTRFIPSEFGSDTLSPLAHKLPVYGAKIAVQEYLAKKVAEGSSLSYTFVLTGAFFDWGLQVGFLVNLKDKKVELYDGGDRPFSTTRLATIGKAVVGILQHPEQTQNRAVYVHDAVVTQNQIIAIAEKKLGGGAKFETTAVKTADLERSSYEELGKPSPNFGVAMVNFVKRAIWGEGYGGEFEKVDNELLGIEPMSEKAVEELVDGLVEK